MQEKYEISINDCSRFSDLISLKSFIEWEKSIIIDSLYCKIISEYQLLNDSNFSSLKSSSTDPLSLIYTASGPDLQILKTEGTEEGSTVSPGQSISRDWLVKTSTNFTALCTEGEYKNQTVVPIQLSPNEYSLSFELTPSFSSLPSIYTLAFKAYTAEGYAFGPELRMNVIIH
jgi:hypothetical protein